MVGLCIVLILLPFLQIGYSYWLAFHMAAAAGAILLTGKSNIGRILTRDLPLRVLLMLLMVVTVIIFGGGGGADIMRSSREALCFFIISGVANHRLQRSFEQLKPVFALVLIFAAGEFLLTLVQSFYLSRGAYFGIPQELFIINAETLPTELDLVFSDIRPMGSYGEPSYLSGVAFSLLFGLRHAVLVNRRALLACVLLTFTVLISRSLSGAIAVSMLWGMILFQSKSRRVFFAVGIAATLGVGFLIAGGDSPFSSRLSSIAAGSDVSFFVRVIAPILAVPDLLIEYPFGIPFLQFVGLGSVLHGQFSTAELIQNGFFNILISYGLFGFGILLLLFLVYRTPSNIFFLMVLMFQNGSFLAFDKVALITVAMLLSNTMQHAQGLRVNTLYGPRGARYGV